jgi:hypothetical protein
MIETATTKTEAGLKVRPIGWEETREILRPLYEGRRHWILVCHIQATPLIQEIERKYYLGDRNGDFTLITGLWRGELYALCAFRKRWMQPYQLGSLLRQMIRFEIGELQGRDLYVPAPPRFLNDAVALAVYLFDGPADLAVGA